MATPEGAEVTSLLGRLAARFETAQPTVREVTALYRSQWFPRLAPGTIAALKSRLAEADRALPDRPTPLDVHAWIVGLVSSGRCNAATANAHRQTLSRAYQIAAMRGLPVAHPAAE